MVLHSSPKKTAPLATGATADIYGWQEGTILKIFKEKNSWHTNEVVATKIAYESGLPVPKVYSDLIEIDQREAIVFERLEGPTMSEFISNNPTEVESCAEVAAQLFSQIHSTSTAEAPVLSEILVWSIHQVDSLRDETKRLILDLLAGLPVTDKLCHNDFHPSNIVMSPSGPVIIDWAVGAKGNPCADYARTWVISRLWLDSVTESDEAKNRKRMWSQFWDIFFHEYEKMNPFSFKDRIQWQIVTTAASLAWDRHHKATEERLAFIKDALESL